MLWTLIVFLFGIFTGWKLKENRADEYLIQQRDSAIRAASNAQARFNAASRVDEDR